MDEADVDNFLFLIIWGISQSLRRLFRVSKGSNEYNFALKLLLSCDLRTQQRLKLQGKLDISKREISVLLKILRQFSEIFDQPTKSTCVPLPKSKIKLCSIISRDILLFHRYKVPKVPSKTLILPSFRFSAIKKCVFIAKLSEVFDCHLFRTELLTWIFTKFIVCTTIAVWLITSMNWTKTTKTSKEFTTWEVIGDVYCFSKSWKWQKCEILTEMSLLRGPLTVLESVASCRFFHNLSISVQEHVKTAKRKKTLPFCQDGTFNTRQTNNEKCPEPNNETRKTLSILRVDNNFIEIIGDVYWIKRKSVFTFHWIKIPKRGFKTSKSECPFFTYSLFHLEKKKPTNDHTRW